MEAREIAGEENNNDSKEESSPRDSKPVHKEEEPVHTEGEWNGA